MPKSRKHTSHHPFWVCLVGLCALLQALFARADTISDLSMEATKGSIGAMLKLAAIYGNAESKPFAPAEAFHWSLEAATLGNADAQRAVGAMYELGKGTTTDYQLAAQWYRKAADQGLARAQCNLGYLYENGLGVNADPDMAFTLYQKAANQGYARSQLYLGACPRIEAVAKSWKIETIFSLIFGQ